MKRETKNGAWIDVSRAVSEETSVWPGDTPFSRKWVMALDAGDACNTSTVTLSSHTGTHVDAPAHFIEGGDGVDRLAVEAFVGRCLVVASKEAQCVRMKDLDRIDLAKEERILFRTPKPIADDEWRDDFSYISVEVAEALAAAGLKLAGIDTPSVDPKNSKTLDAHKMLLSGGVAILENLNLAGVEDGRYELIALPLRIAGGDASPVRALIRRARGGAT